MDRFVVISGCSGGGKSSLLEELKQRGHQVVEEPGRRIVKEELANGGSALPWADPIAFARRAVEISLSDFATAPAVDGFVFFDRGLVDAVAALQRYLKDERTESWLRQHRYNKHVFLAPPWREIYVVDTERRHGFTEAIEEFQQLRSMYPSLGYDVHILPKLSVERRADFVVSTVTNL
ncbi:MAG: AAA family ATPase [Alphaproteobacteria bacterium]|nr:AAA family ATPase [Alphaproteobacteria bacterium]